jgi:hypothetical protein
VAALLSLAILIGTAPASFASSSIGTMPDTCLGHHEHRESHAMPDVAAHHGSVDAPYQDQQKKEQPHRCCCDGLGCMTIAGLLPMAAAVPMEPTARFARALPTTLRVGVAPDPDPDPPRPIALL